MENAGATLVKVEGLLPLCSDPDCASPHPDGCVGIVDIDDLGELVEMTRRVSLWIEQDGAELVALVRELGPVLDAVRALAPIVLPVAAELAAELTQVARGGPVAVLGFLGQVIRQATPPTATVIPWPRG